MNLLFSSVGDSIDSYKSWFGTEKNYEIAICYYGNDEKRANELEEKSDYFFRSEGSKFQNFNKFESELEYDFVYVVDDDIKMPPEDINKCFNFISTNNIDVSSPSHNSAGKISFKHMVQKNNSEYRFTNYVEMTAVFMSKKAVNQFLELYTEDQITGWGTDFIISSTCYSDKNPFYILDFCSITNPKDEDKGGNREINNLKSTEERIKEFRNIEHKLKIHKNEQIQVWENTSQKSNLLTLFKNFFKPKQFEYKNIEGDRNYDFSLPIKSPKKKGISGVIRIKNEEKNINMCLESVYSLFDEIVLVDNGSSDKSLDLINKFIGEKDIKKKIRLFNYPFELARFGPDHEITHENSLNSAVYFSNWALSKCKYNYICKWDADMIFKNSREDYLKEKLSRIVNIKDQVYFPIGQTVYVNTDNKIYYDPDELNSEQRIFPNNNAYNFRKSELFEYTHVPENIERKKFKEVMFYEIKRIEDNEFEHWSTSDFKTDRKKQEWQNYCKIKNGDFEGFKILTNLNS